MTWELPPDSRAMTHDWNPPPPEYDPPDTAAVACAGAYDVAATGAGAGAGAGPSCPGAAGILAGRAGTFSTWPVLMMLAQWTLSRLAQYSTGQAFCLWYTLPAILESESPDRMV